jgi:hypothetical protein
MVQEQPGQSLATRQTAVGKAASHDRTEIHVAKRNTLVELQQALQLK